jgi:hypothetical protein
MNPTATDAEILGLRLAPARVGPRVGARRHALFGDAATIAIAAADGAATATWPDPTTVRRGDRLVLRIGDDDDSRGRWLQWLRRLATADLVGGVSVAPVGADSAGLHRLWCITAARLCLPAGVLVEVRHDLVGMRIAQIALGMGADVLAGPIAPDRALPLAGVTRPTDHTLAGLRTIVAQAGFRPVEPLPPSSCPRRSPSPAPAPR